MINDGVVGVVGVVILILLIVGTVVGLNYLFEYLFY